MDIPEFNIETKKRMALLIGALKNIKDDKAPNHNEAINMLSEFIQIAVRKMAIDIKEATPKTVDILNRSHKSIVNDLLELTSKNHINNISRILEHAV